MATNSNRRRGTTTRRSTGFSIATTPYTRRNGRRTYGSAHSTPANSVFGGYSDMTWNRTGTGSTRTVRTTASRTGAAGYRTIGNTLEQKINSFKTLYAQTTGPSTVNRPSPSTLNSFANWVNKGAVVYRVAPTQVARWSNTNRRVSSATTAKTVLCQKFGKSAIKAVTCDKSGGFLVATNPTFNAKMYNFTQC